MNDREIAVLRALADEHAAGRAMVSMSGLSRALGWPVHRTNIVCAALWQRDLIAQEVRQRGTTRLTDTGRQALCDPASVPPVTQTPRPPIVEYQLLRWFYFHPDPYASPALLHRVLHGAMPRSSLYAALTRLRGKGLVTRTRPIHLTDSGRQAAMRLILKQPAAQ